MSLNVERKPDNGDTSLLPEYRGNRMIVTVIGDEDIALFQQAINRAANCWDRAPAKFKTFADIVTEGRELQKYEDLGSEVKPA